MRGLEVGGLAFRGALPIASGGRSKRPARLPMASLPSLLGWPVEAPLDCFLLLGRRRRRFRLVLCADLVISPLRLLPLRLGTGLVLLALEIIPKLPAAAGVAQAS
jgi:hypothetical protein